MGTKKLNSSPVSQPASEISLEEDTQSENDEGIDGNVDIIGESDEENGVEMDDEPDVETDDESEDISD